MKRTFHSPIIALAFSALFFSTPNLSSSFESTLHGKAIMVHATRLNEKKEHPGSLVSEQGIQIQFHQSNESGSTGFLVKADLWNDSVENKGVTDIREAFVNYSLEALDLRMGRQIITWGVGDRIYVSDVFPKDWNAFFTGRPMEYQKLASTGLKANYYPSIGDFEFVFFPIFRPDNTPNPERFRLPGMGTENPPIEQRRGDFGDSEFGFRFQKSLFDTSFAFHGYRGYWRQYDKGSKIIDGTQTFFYPRMNMVSLTAQRPLFGAILSIEGGYYDSLDDHGQDAHSIADSQWRYIFGIEKELATDLIAGIQYYGEYTENMDDLPTLTRDKGSHILTLNVRKMFLDQTLTLSSWFMSETNRGDYFFNPEAKYNVTDELEVATGANFFGGSTDGYVGQFDKNDNFYLRMIYQF